MRRIVLSTFVALASPSLGSAEPVLTVDDILARFEAQQARRLQDGATEREAPQAGAGVLAPADAPPVVEPALTVDIAVSLDPNDQAAREDFHAKLEPVCRVIRLAPSDWRFNVIGHTGGAGPASYNTLLSELLANEAARYFTDRCGVGSERIETWAMGETRLRNERNPDAKENLRIEVSLAD